MLGGLSRGAVHPSTIPHEHRFSWKWGLQDSKLSSFWVATKRLIPGIWGSRYREIRDKKHETHRLYWSWLRGGPTMAMIANKCPEYEITVVDINAEKIDQWNSDQLPIFEPGLDDLVRQNRGKNLFFSTDTAGAIRKADIIFVSVNTPTKTFGVGNGYASICNTGNKPPVRLKTIPITPKLWWKSPPSRFARPPPWNEFSTTIPTASL